MMRCYRKHQRVISYTVIFLLIISMLIHQYSDIPEELVAVDREFSVDRIQTILKYPAEIKPSELDHQSSHPHLPRALNEKQRLELFDLLTTLVNLLEQNNVTYIMADGTLLGSYFFHDVIPWDDDLDILLSWEDFPRIRKLFSDRTLRQTYDVRSYHSDIDWYSLDSLERGIPKLSTFQDDYFFQQQQGRAFKFKFFANSGRSSGEYPWKWPFIDLKYFRETPEGAGIYIMDYFTDREIINLKSDVFPIHHRPFGNLWLPAPRNTRQFLKTKYGKFTCTGHSWDHINERYQQRRYAFCRDVIGTYTHVHRTWIDNNTCVESLLLQDKILHSVQVKEPYHKILGYYDLK